MRHAIIVILILMLISVHVFSLEKATEAGRLPLQGDGSSFVIPTPVLRMTALEYKGLASDFFFLKALVFMGATYERKEIPRVKEWEWRWLYNVLAASAGLDPYFFDPYNFANAHLTWEGNMIRETNVLLDKGARYRDWDSLLPFYIGFNYFFFLQDYEKAGEYLIEASRKPGAWPIYAGLAAKMAYKNKKTETAIMFLEEILSKTEDELMKKEYQDRLDALKGVYFLEQALAVFKKRFGRSPKSIDELIIRRVIDSLPLFPYEGGYYYIDAQGDIRTTNESILLPNRRINY